MNLNKSIFILKFILLYDFIIDDRFEAQLEKFDVVI